MGNSDCKIEIQVAPWWEASQEGAELMLKYGIEYGPLPHGPVNILRNPSLTPPKITASPTMTAYLTTSVLATNGPQLTTANTLTIG